MKLKNPIITYSILLSVILSFGLNTYWTISKKKLFVRCEIKVDQVTTLSLFTNTGKGYNENNVGNVQLPAYSCPQYVKFRIQTSKAKNFRLDFNSNAVTINLNNCQCMQDEYGLDTDKTGIASLIPLHNVNVEKIKNTQHYIITKIGKNPQIKLKFNFFLFYLKKIIFPFFIYFFLCYPVCFAALSLVFRCLGNRRFRITKLHTALLVFALTLWALLPCAYRSAQSRHVFVDVQQAREKAQIPLPAGGEPVAFRRADGLEIAARLFQNNPEAPVRGSILLLHGNYPQAQDFPLYSLMAQALAAKGFRVLTMDFAGFGRSQTPFASDRMRRFDLESETETALAYLKTLGNDRTKLSIIGHSLGANPALRVGLRDPAVQSIVLIGPPRRVWERFRDPNDVEYFWLWALAVGVHRYGKEQPPAWYTPEQMQTYFLEHDMASDLAELRKWRHKPVYFLDGDREDQDDKDLVFLQSYTEKVSAPCEYVTIRGSDHNLNVQSANYWAFVMDFITRASGGNTATPGSGPPAHFDSITYDPPTLRTAVDILERWCDREQSLGDRAKTLFRNILRLLFPFM